MNAKLLAAAAVALILIPAAANAQREPSTGDAVSGTHEAAPLANEYRANAGNGVVGFVTRLIVPDFNDRRPSVAYADNPELIGSRPGASDPAWHK